ncbi:hypothetical protein [Pseudidiomarina terrestris]|uniref:hypothetical protein n=1 Tax=Pseudidiomarina terrestris TaxID=2820060 RepID=UPI002658D4CF|nr:MULTISPECIES: hypothetical protein [unclassified Pseudidiomarina]
MKLVVLQSLNHLMMERDMLFSILTQGPVVARYRERAHGFRCVHRQFSTFH